MPFKEFTDSEAKELVKSDLEDSGLAKSEIDEIVNFMFVSASSPIDGIHICYFTDPIEDIIGNKQIGNDHNPVLKILNLSKSGNEKEKVQRIIDELIRLGHR